MVSGGVFDQSTYEEDGPVPWEALPLLDIPWVSGEPATRLRRTTRLRVHVSSAQQWHRTSARIEGGHRQGDPEPWPTGAGSRRAAEER